MLSFDNWRMISCATVSPPMPESKTPTGRDEDMRRLPANAKGQTRRRRRRAERDLSREIPEQRGDVRVGGRKEMVRGEHGDPILEVRAARTQQSAGEW